MRDLAEVFDEDCVDAQHGVLVALGLKHVAHRQRAHIAAVFEIARIDGLLPDLVENFPGPGSTPRNARGIGGLGAADVLILVVFLGSPDDPVLRYILHDLLDLGSGKGTLTISASP